MKKKFTHHNTLKMRKKKSNHSPYLPRFTPKYLSSAAKMTIKKAEKRRSGANYEL